MPTSTYLSNPKVTVGGNDLSDQCTAATFTIAYDALESTAFGDSSRKFTSGLGNHSVTLTFYASFATSETWAVLSQFVGNDTATIVVKPNANAVDSATNPGLTLTGAFLPSLPIATSLGELGTVDVTFQGGVFTTDTTNP
jgi:hypothetical protein